MEQQAAAKGDVRFFELAYLDVEIKQPDEQHRDRRQLKDFVIPNTELVPEDVREQDQEVVRLHRLLGCGLGLLGRHLHAGLGRLPHAQGALAPTRSDPHTYEKPGKYAVMVKVIDIFGNDTSKICSVRVG